MNFKDDCILMYHADFADGADFLFVESFFETTFSNMINQPF